MSVFWVNENDRKRAEEATVQAMGILGTAAVFPGILEAAREIEGV